MTSGKIDYILDAAAGALATVDPKDDQDFADIVATLEHLSTEAHNCGFEVIAHGARAAQQLIRAVLDDPAGDRCKVHDVLTRTVLAFQHMTRSGTEEDGQGLPLELFSLNAPPQGTAPRTFSLPTHLDDGILNDFLNDQDNVLEEMERYLLGLEKQHDGEAVAGLKRLYHTLKGEAAILGLHDVEKLCHMTEDLIDISSDKLPVDALLAIKDWLKDVFDAIKNKAGLPELNQNLLSCFTVLQNGPNKGGTADEVDKGQPDTLVAAVELLAKELVTADPYRLQDLGTMLTCLQTIERECVAAGQTLSAKAVAAAGMLVQDVMLDEKQDRNALIDILNRTVSHLQHSLRAGGSPSASAFPAELGVSPASLSHQITEGYTLPENIDEDIFSAFIQDQYAALEMIETHLLRLEKKTDRNAIAELKRIFHTLKGEAAVFGLESVTLLCHATEELFESTSECPPCEMLLTIKDWLKSVFDALANRGSIPQLDEKLREFVAGQLPGATDITSKSDSSRLLPAEAASDGDAQFSPANANDAVLIGDIDLLADFVSEVQEHLDTIDNKLLSLETNPQDDDLLNAVFRVFHTIKGTAGFLNLEDISRLAHTTENLLDRSRKKELLLEGRKIDLVFEAVDTMKRLIAAIREAIVGGSNTYQTDPALDDLIERLQLLASGGCVPVSSTLPQCVHAATVDNRPCSDMVPGLNRKAVAGLSAAQGLPGEQQPFSALPQKPKIKLRESIKVDSENLDRLVDAIGELVIIESMISQSPEIKKTGSASLQRNIAQMDKISRELQHLGMSLRMIPVKATFHKMARVVRDVAKKNNKKIDFDMSGEDTMLDKSVVDRIGDPLIHLVRNSVDHGIEASSAERKKAGKSETGKVNLKAFHKGGNIYIEIHDDGRGLDKDAIVTKAMEKGLINANRNIDDSEIYNMIFLPGFSTAKKVTEVSGRGVGMDVVRRTIEDLRGGTEISSFPGQGTSFSLRLPLTLAIIDGMLVRVARERYIIPTLSIVEAIRPQREDLITIVNKGEMIRVRDDLIPLFRIANLFNIPGSKDDPAEAIVIVVEEGGRKTGLLVDELHGQQSTVIKSLGTSMKNLMGVSGGSILSDGTVGIILDIAGIVKLATTHSTVHVPEKQPHV